MFYAKAHGVHLTCGSWPTIHEPPKWASTHLENKYTKRYGALKMAIRTKNAKFFHMIFETPFFMYE